MNAHDFDGAHTAMVTPFKDGKIAWDDTEKLIEHQIAAGIQGIVAVGTTGESPTLGHDEHISFIKFVVEKVAGRANVIAGTGSNSTEEALDYAQSAEAVGIDAHLQVAPYYNKPTQEGLFRHFSSVASKTEKPIILYSIPGRCGIAIEVDTIERLYQKHPTILGIKEAGGSCDRVAEINQRLGDDYLILSGDDALTVPFMTFGATGVISVASNIIPEKVVQLANKSGDADFAELTNLNKMLNPLFRVLFVESNPVPVKYALYKKGLISSPEVRSPLCELSENNKTLIEEIIQ